MAESILQYILGYGTWYGLSTIGEPPLTKSQPRGSEGSCLPSPSPLQDQGSPSRPSQDPMPAWLIFLFFTLVSARYIFSYLFAYVFQVVSAVVMVSSEDVSTIGAARAERHPAAPRQDHRLNETGPSQPRRLHRSLTRSLTMPIESLGRRFFGLAGLRGLDTFLILSVAQWYLGAITDFLLSGQPKELMPGYGSSSVIFAIFFGGSSALWTHYAITEPSNRKDRKVYHLFPHGSDVIELFPITCLWAICEQITMSIPLAMSRSQFFRLREFAWDPTSWNDLDPLAQRILLGKFALVYFIYLILAASLSIPSTIVLRRIHASMLPEAGKAIVPYTRGNPRPRTSQNTNGNSRNSENDNDGENRNRTPPSYRPGLSVSQAWATLTWAAYVRVLRISVLYFIANQLIHLACWEADRKLHDFFQTDQYAVGFPSGPTRLNLQIF